MRMIPGAAIRVITTYPEPFWREAGLCGESADPRSPVVITIDQCPKGGTPGVLSSYAFGPPALRLAKMSPTERRATWLSELVQRFGPAAGEPTGYLETDWSAEEWSLGGMISHFPPGTLTSYGSALRTPVGRIHWAGAERATEMHGLIEGAVRSGERAADEGLRPWACHLPFGATVAMEGGARVTRYVIGTDVALRLAAEEATIPGEHELLAPTLLRSQVLSSLYQEVQRGDLTKDDADQRLTYLRGLRLRLLGDRVLQNVAWKIAQQLEWSDTFDAEYVALTQLQADAFVTLDRHLARAVSPIVTVATIDELLR
jgi:predicted nucleic acid-binding protein